MKKTILCAVLVLAILCLAACGSMTKVGSFKSSIYTDDEFQEAVSVVLTYFEDFEGCEMTELHYAGDDAVLAEAEARGLAPDQIIVLKSTFKTDSEDHQNGLEPDYTYEDFGWTLTRVMAGAPWEHLDHGYG